MSDPLAELRDTFFLECDELLEKLETDLLALEAGSDDEECVNSAFRAVHSIKGGAGAFGMTAITECAHVFETVMDHVRSGALELNPDLCTLFLRGKDLLSALIAEENGGPTTDPGEIATVTQALEEICPEEDEDDLGDIFKPVSINADLGIPNPEDNAGDVDPLDILAQFEGPDTEDKGDLQIAFAPKPAFFARGNDVAPFIRELCTLGDADVLLDASQIPSFDDLDPTAPYFEWQINLTGSVPQADIESIFEFVADDCALSIGHALPLLSNGGEEQDTVGPDEILPGSRPFIDFEAEEEAQSPDNQLTERETESLAIEPNAEALSLEPEVNQDTPDKVIEKTTLIDAQKPKDVAQPARASAPKPVVRVELGRVDRLINLVSELVISQSMLSQAVEDHHGGTEDQAILSGLDEFRQLTRELQESVMAIRAEPVRSMFMRMGQIARSTANSCGKKVRLITDGEHTEVDKTVIERLAEPLTHMIRNAVDHGIERIEDRIKAGKDEVGSVHLSADHHSGRVVLTVQDDGGGVDRERVRAKAIEKGIIAEDAQLSDQEIDQLLFAPGFSTAASISQVSGRGVGMDVVKREITSLGGRINLTSKPGEGTTFTISLPLTLAVLDGMVISVAGQTVVLPLSVIAESLRPEPEDIQNIGEEQVIFVRGQFVPILDVGDALGYRAPLDTFVGKVMLLVENDHGTNFAFAVDEIVDQRQVVIKGLQENYGRIEGVAAATILGDGQIALILDVNDLTAEQSALGAGFGVQAA
ncbi:MAG: chemotaxis protein CheA [Pseudomonadota bacterium]